MKNRINFLPVFILILCLFVNNYSQVDSTFIQSIRINGNTVSKLVWNNLIISRKDVISIDFDTKRATFDGEEVLHRILLNGNPINLDDLHSKTISFSQLDSGNYLLKIQGYTNTSSEARPVYIKFCVGVCSPIPVQTTYSSSDFIINKKIFYGAIALILILIATIAFRFKLGGGRNKKAIDDDHIEKLNRKDLIKEFKIKADNLKDLYYSYNRMKEEISNMRENNNNLRVQIKELKQHIANLEQANSELLEQKTRLEKSIVLGEELHDKKEKLFATAVHDIKNPASAIKGYVELLESFDLNAGEQKEILQYLVDTSSRIVQLAQKMSVAIAKDDNQADSHFESSSIKALIDSVCNQNIASANRKQIQLINNSSPQTPYFEIDCEKMHEAIDNVVSNAIKFSYPKSSVIVKTYFNEKKVFIEVVDTGVGMNEEDLKHLFEKGSNLSAKPTAGEETSGLGLWIVKGIIDEHGGSIKVTSKKDVGTTVKIELPIKRKNN